MSQHATSPVSGQEFVDYFNSEYFGGGLSADVIDRLRALPVERDDACAFLDRLGKLARTAGLDPHDVSPLQAELLGSLISRLLPGTWSGRIPPITIPGRHQKFDELVKRVCGERGRMLDIACGFPPFTTLDSARALPGWTIVGADRSLPEYLVEDGRGNYASLDVNGAAQYFQPYVPTGDSWFELLNDTDASRRRFEGLLQQLLEVRRSRAAAGGDAPRRIEHDGATLVVHPVSDYAGPNLSFVRADLDDLQTEPADVVRCFNMLMYFDDAFRQRALGHFSRLLKEGGLVLCGCDWAFSMEARYTTYRKAGGALVPQEFAFGLDNLVPIGILSWYTLQPDDRDAAQLASFCGVLRSDRTFFAQYSKIADAFRAEFGMCARRSDGYFGDIDKSIPPNELWPHAAEFPERLGAQLNERAVAVLKAAGYQARINEVGHLAVRVNSA